MLWSFRPTAFYRYLTYKQNSKDLPHVFERKLFSSVNSSNCLIPEVYIAATKPEVIISRVAWQVSLKFQRLFSRFRRRPQILMSAMSPFTGSKNTATTKPEVVISHVAAKAEEKFQRPCRRFN